MLNIVFIKNKIIRLNISAVRTSRKPTKSRAKSLLNPLPIVRGLLLIIWDVLAAADLLNLGATSGDGY
jgi:hypothetical protein